MSNENCLIGLRCPNQFCESTEPFKITAEASFLVYDDGTGEPSQIEWAADSPCVCVECGKRGVVGDFKDKKRG